MQAEREDIFQSQPQTLFSSFEYQQFQYPHIPSSQSLSLNEDQMMNASSSFNQSKEIPNLESSILDSDEPFFGSKESWNSLEPLDLSLANEQKSSSWDFIESLLQDSFIEDDSSSGPSEEQSDDIQSTRTSQIRRSNIRNDYRSVYRQTMNPLKDYLYSKLHSVHFNKHKAPKKPLSDLIMAETLGGILFAFRNFPSIARSLKANIENFLRNEERNLGQTKRNLLRAILEAIQEINYLNDNQIQNFLIKLSQVISKTKIYKSRISKEKFLEKEEEFRKFFIRESLSRESPMTDI